MITAKPNDREREGTRLSRTLKIGRPRLTLRLSRNPFLIGRQLATLFLQRRSSLVSPIIIPPTHSPDLKLHWWSKTMYLQYYINENGDKVYTTKKESPLGLATQSAHPARFSPDDKYSRQRFLLKKRFGLLPTQQPPQKY